MYEVEVRAADDATLVFTVTTHDRTPWGAGNTMILVTADQLSALINNLQARLQEIEQMRAARPTFALGADVQVVTEPRQGQRGTVIEARPKKPRLVRHSGEHWAYTVRFADGMTWSYNGDHLATGP